MKIRTVLAAALASAAVLGAGGSASAACEPGTDPSFCTGYVTQRVRDLVDRVPENCEYDPQSHTITCRG